MNIPKINFASVKSKVGTIANSGKDCVLNGVKSAKTLAVDTLNLTKTMPKQAAVVAGVGVAGAAVVAGLVTLIKSGVEKVAENKYN